MKTSKCEFVQHNKVWIVSIAHIIAKVIITFSGLVLLQVL